MSNDDALLAGLRAGDEAVFVRLVDAWSAGMLRAARGYVASRESAEDVVQDTWLALIRGIDRFEGRSSLRTWVYRVLINIAKTRGEKDSRTVPVADLGTGPTVDPAPWPSVESEVELREVRRHIDAAVDALPARQRVVITLRDVEGYSSEEVCATLEISTANQRVLLHRARAAIRARLEDYFTAAQAARWTLTRNAASPGTLSRSGTA